MRDCRLASLLLVALGAPAVLAGCGSGERAEPVANQCITCHEDRQYGFSPDHAFARNDCTLCHAGDGGATDETAAHSGLLAFPGNLDNAEQACGACHANRVAAVAASLMHTGRGMVHTTRLVIDGDAGPAHTQNLQSLGDTVADSMLRKVCASCHLGQPRTVHAIDVTTSRGGGCLACHVGAYPEESHIALTREVSDGRCFGCHSRSGRISLSYTGLAEVDASDLRLADGRTVEQFAPDVHYDIGMGCKDCHDADDVMGGTGMHQRDAVAAACTDCHEPHADDTDHARLECAACHSQWAPQCFGCHMEYEEDGEQWDHIERRTTPGRWHDERWNVRNTLPALGVNADNRIEVFVPGMIMTVAHPSWDESKFIRMFAPLSPHTSGKSRSCASCHRSSEALGLGRGELTLTDGKLEFTPASEMLPDGLPADAWTDVRNTLGGRAPWPGQRPFNAQEMRRIYTADIQQDSSAGGGSGSRSSASSSVNTGGTNLAAGRSAEPSRSPTK